MEELHSYKHSRYIDILSDFFIQRSVSYVSRLISEQIPKGGRSEWRYDINDISEYSNLPKEEKDMYDLSIKRKWDYKNTIDYVKKEGLEKGRKEGVEEGLEKGRQEGIEEKTMEFISNLIRKSQMTDIEIAEIAGTEIELVKNIRGEL